MAEGARQPGEGRLLIIVPAYNEAESIPRVLEDLREHVPEADVVVVDDGSTDATAEVAESLAAAVLQLPCNLGVGGAMRTGYLYARGHGYDLAVQFDGDGQHRADQVRALLAGVIEDGVDLAIGSRRLGAGSYRFSLARRVGSRLVAAVAFLVTRLRLTDPTSGFRASSRRMIAFFAEHYPQTYLGDTIESTVLAARHGMKVREIGAEMRPSARSSVGNLMGLFHTVCICLAILVDCIERKFPDRAEPDAPEKESPS
jgi:glycosyltransferase involved in cell wall biosynthesis